MGGYYEHRPGCVCRRCNKTDWEPYSFKAPRKLLESLREAASSRGIGASELLRDALEAYLGCMVK